MPHLPPAPPSMPPLREAQERMEFFDLLVRKGGEEMSRLLNEVHVDVMTIMPYYRNDAFTWGETIAADNIKRSLREMLRSQGGYVHRIRDPLTRARRHATI